MEAAFTRGHACRMARWNRCYAKYGNKAAILTVVFPGLGQLHNKQFLKGMAMAAAFCTWSLSFLCLSFSRLLGYQTGSTDLTSYLLFLTLITWEVSLFDAFICAVRLRKRDAKRFKSEELVIVSGLDVNKEKFEQAVPMRNLSKTGACFVISREIKKGSLLTVEFQSRPKCQGRVIWQRQTDCEDELMVGVEFLKPLTVL
jgi:hypothetical protein